jgi:hypothetical protein
MKYSQNTLHKLIIIFFQLNWRLHVHKKREKRREEKRREHTSRIV